MLKVNKEDIMLVDVQYVRPSRKYGTNDYLYVIYKDINTGEKFLHTIEEPKFTVYVEKEEYRDHKHNEIFKELDRLDPITIKYKDIYRFIASLEGDYGKDFLLQVFENKQYDRLKELLLYPYIFGADTDIRVWFRYNWMKNFNNDKVKPIKKAFADIEVDSFESSGMPDPRWNPIDLITYIDNDTKNAYTFALTGVDFYPKTHPNMTESELAHEEYRKKLYTKRTEQHMYWSTHVEELKEEAHKLFDESYPGFKYNIFFYDNELKMINHFFQVVNKLEPDMLAFWNIAFDIPYIIDRLVALGVDPAEIICHKDFPNKQCYFKKDKFHYEVKNKTDFFNVSSKTVYVDQMINYASIRKGQSELRSNKLTFIAKKEIGDEKLDYSDAGNIKTISYIDYKKYLLYNIKDVLLQYGIESKTEDMETYYTSSYENITPYEDVFKQTVTLRDYAYMDYLDQGVVQGTNINIINRRSITEKSEFDEFGNIREDKEDDDTTFEGALVGDPRLIDRFGVKLFDKMSDNVFKYSIDLDMSAFYPYTIIVNNIIASALSFKMVLEAKAFSNRGGKYKFNGYTDISLLPDEDDSFSGDISKELADNLQSRNYISLAHKWLNYPSVNEIYEKMMKGN